MAEHRLLFEVMIYLAAAVVFVPLASRLGLGSVLGYLLAGCVIGPFGLRLVRRRRGDPALRRIRRGADAVRDRARAGAEAALGHAPRGVRRRRRCRWASAARVARRSAASAVGSALAGRARRRAGAGAVVDGDRGPDA